LIAGADSILVLEEMAQRERIAFQFHGKLPSATGRKMPVPETRLRPAQKDDVKDMPRYAPNQAAARTAAPA
jgi:hypothetical protein